jgi:hypothetical protein
MVMLEQAIDEASGPEALLLLDPFVQLAAVDDAIDDLAVADLGGLDAEWFAR